MHTLPATGRYGIVIHAKGHDMYAVYLDDTEFKLRELLTGPILTHINVSLDANAVHMRSTACKDMP